MMETTVSTLAIVCMGIAAICAIAIPVGLYLYFRKKMHADRLPFWIGCVVFPVFALGLEQVAYLFVMKLDCWLFVQSDIWLYGMVGGLFAGIFEETGRYVAFRTVLRKKRGNDANALMYGAGHGGIEAALLVGVTMISNIVYSLMLNSGALDSTMSTTISTALAGAAPGMFLVSIVERVGAVALHLSLSVLVWFAAKNKKSFCLFPIAILLHALVDAVAVIMSGYAVNVWLIEGAIYLMSAGCALLAVLVWKRQRKADAIPT
jgi:uncharacterized membrane protein YhfC